MEPTSIFSFFHGSKPKWSGHKWKRQKGTKRGNVPEKYKKIAKIGWKGTKKGKKKHEKFQLLFEVVNIIADFVKYIFDPFCIVLVKGQNIICLFYFW